MYHTRISIGKYEPSFNNSEMYLGKVSHGNHKRSKLSTITGIAVLILLQLRVRYNIILSVNISKVFVIKNKNIYIRL